MSHLLTRWAAAGLFAVSGAVSAAVLSSGGTYIFDYNDAAASWSGSLTIEVLSLDSTSLTADLTMKSDSTSYAGSRLAGFALDFSPSVGATNFVANVDGGEAFFIGFAAPANGNYNGFTVDICTYTGQNCQGGGNTGLLPGESDAFRLTLTRTSSAAAWSLLSAPVKVQAGPGNTSHHFDSCTLSGEGCETDPCRDDGCTPDPCTNGGCANVPTPASAALLGIGMVAFAATRVRRRGSAR